MDIQLFIPKTLVEWTNPTTATRLSLGALTQAKYNSVYINNLSSGSVRVKWGDGTVVATSTDLLIGSGQCMSFGLASDEAAPTHLSLLGVSTPIGIIQAGISRGA